MTKASLYSRSPRRPAPGPATPVGTRMIWLLLACGDPCKPGGTPTLEIGLGDQIHPLIAACACHRAQVGRGQMAVMQQRQRPGQRRWIAAVKTGHAEQHSDLARGDIACKPRPKMHHRRAAAIIGVQAGPLGSVREPGQAELQFAWCQCWR